MIAYFDVFSGISGDMTLGAFIDLGVPVDWLQKELSKLSGGFELKTQTVFKHHLKATDLLVQINGQDKSSRNYTDIRSMIEQCDLSEAVKQRSLAAFKKIALAESDIHGKNIETVHFHEIGGIDSIVDIVGSFLCVEYLGIKKVYASQIPLGSGFVTCSHGKIPVPVPATIAILKDIPVCSSDATTEIVTPTGAAIIATLADAFGPMPSMAVTKVGYGAGKRDTGASVPNLLRIILGHDSCHTSAQKYAVQKEKVMVVKTNIDDMSPELSGYLMETLFDNKALDVCFLPAGMKKNRPGTQVEVICQSVELDNIIRIILTQTSSIGVRYHECDRAFLQREEALVDTRFGTLKVKKIINPDHSIRFVPEYEIVRRVAQQQNLPLKDVHNQILRDANPIDADSSDTIS